jgi:hypothetical protein
MLGTSDDVIILWGSSIVQGSVTFVQYADGYYYHDNADNTYIKMNLGVSSYTASIIGLGKDQILGTSDDITDGSIITGLDGLH